MFAPVVDGGGTTKAKPALASEVLGVAAAVGSGVAVTTAPAVVAVGAAVGRAGAAPARGSIAASTTTAPPVAYVFTIVHLKFIHCHML